MNEKCTATCNDGSECNAYSMEGTDKCRMHRGTSSDGKSHTENENAVTHGAFKEHFRSDLTDDEKDAIDSLVSHLEDIDDSRVVAAEVAAEALIKYKRSADDRFLREARQWFDKFNLMPSEEQLELTGEGGSPLNVVVERNEYTE